MLRGRVGFRVMRVVSFNRACRTRRVATVSVVNTIPTFSKVITAGNVL
jgi:hypothetical protein